MSNAFLDPSFLRSDAAVPDRPRRFHSPSFGSARGATWDEVALSNHRASLDPRGTAFANASVLVERADRRGELEAHYSVGLGLTEAQRNAHLLVVGPPGTGKTSRVLLPLLAADIADRERSVVFVDVKGEGRGFVEALVARHRLGTRTIVLNLRDPQDSVRWNPLAGCSLAAIGDVVHTLCTAAQLGRGDGDSPFWQASAHTAITAIARTLASNPAECASFGRIRDVVTGGLKKLGAWVAQNDHGGRLHDLIEFLGTGSHNAHTVLADIRMRLAAFEDPRVREVTSQSDFDPIADLVDRPSVLIVEMDEAHVSALRPIWSLFFARLFETLLDAANGRPNGALPRPVSIHMDEFASAIGWLPDMQVRLNTLRSRRVGITAAVQSLAQIGNVYGREADSIVRGFRSKIFCAECESSDAAFASHKSGTTTVEVEYTARSERIQNGEVLIETTHSVHPAARPLLLPDEIAYPPEHFALGRPLTMFLADLQPFQAWLLPAHEDEHLAPLLRGAPKHAA